MISASFEYVRPASLDEAIRILNEREGEAKLLAGGYSLIPLLKLRLGQPGVLVDLQAVGGLDGIIETDDDLRIGARATHRQIHENVIVRDHYPMVEEVAGGDRRPAGPQLGHDRRLRRPRRSGVRLARRADRLPRDDRLSAARTESGRSRPVTSSSTRSRPRSSRPRSSPRSGSRAARRPRAPATASSSGRSATSRPSASPSPCGSRTTGRIEASASASPASRRAPFAATDAEAIAGRRAARRGALSAESATRPRPRAEPAADIRGPVDYKRAMVSEMTVRSFRKAVERARSFA